MAKFNEESSFAEVLETKEGTEATRKHLGALLDRPSLKI